jgi:four helix bundle protein
VKRIDYTRFDPMRGKSRLRAIISPMADFQNLNVWRKAHALSLATFAACEGISGPIGVLLRNQLVRSVMSIQSNIAEGSAKQSDREFARYVRIAMGSATETENHLLLAGDYGMIEKPTADALKKEVKDVRKMLTGLVKTLVADASSTPRRPRPPRSR